MQTHHGETLAANDNGRPPLLRFAPYVVMAASLVLLAYTCWREATQAGVTMDEIAYINIALGVRDRLSFREFTTWGVAPLPVLAFHLPAIVIVGSEPYDVGPFPFFGRPEFLPAIKVARLLTAAVCGAVIWIFTVCWLRRVAGIGAAAAGSVLVAASPMLVATMSLATTDALFTATVLAAIAAVDRARRLRSRASLWLASLAVGVCFAAKYSCIALIPVFAWWLIPAGPAGFRRTVAWAWESAKLGLVALAIAWLAHAGEMVSLDRHPKPASEVGPGLVARARALFGSLVVPAPIKGFVMQAYMVTVQPAPNYLMGRLSDTGFREFYFVGMAVKSNPAETCLLAIGFVAALAALARVVASRGTDAAGGKGETIVASSIALALLATLSLSKKQWGVRYVLPLYPIFGALAIMALWRTRLGRGAAILLVAAHAGFMIAAPPGLLSYFNPALGGRKNGDRWLVGVDYDWGQGLKELHEWYQREGGGRPVFYSGMGDIKSYAFNAPTLDKFDPNSHPRALLLASRHCLRSPDELIDFLDVPPLATPSDITVVYDLSRPETLAAVEARKARLADLKRKKSAEVAK
ncbi:MAG TPA: hypothetical protein VNC50_07845 [Planctomycetia bacterium]|nr:hypothetical protein [Planctomycetia bacterium]